jgi:hypothetical protein
MRRKISLLLTILLIAFGATAASKSEGTPKIQFAETSHDFGVIKAKNGPVSYSFEFSNIGDGPLLILSASASCGCTRPDYPKDPVKAGKNGGEFTKTVTVRTNAKGSKKINLKIKGNIVPEAEE